MSADTNLDSATDRIELVERSLRCFVFGLIGLVPVLGLPFGIAAIVKSVRLKRRSGERWNPAQSYAKGGSLCATLGIVLTLIAVCIAVAVAINNYLSQQQGLYLGSHPLFD